MNLLEENSPHWRWRTMLVVVALVFALAIGAFYLILTDRLNAWVFAALMLLAITGSICWYAWRGAMFYAVVALAWLAAGAGGAYLYFWALDNGHFQFINNEVMGPVGLCIVVMLSGTLGSVAVIIIAATIHRWRHRMKRFPKNAPGHFYTLGYQSRGKWCGECMACEAPEAEAPELLAPLKNGNHDTYFVRQPETPIEVEHACRAAEVCCVYALRYDGIDPKIIGRLGNTPLLSDFILIRGKPVFFRRPYVRWWHLPILWLRFWFVRTKAQPIR
jgi:hypothetical protein